MLGVGCQWLAVTSVVSGRKPTASHDSPHIGELILTQNSLFLVRVVIFQLIFIDAATGSMLKHIFIAKIRIRV